MYDTLERILVEETQESLQDLKKIIGCYPHYEQEDILLMQNISMWNYSSSFNSSLLGQSPLVFEGDFVFSVIANSFSSVREIRGII